MRILQVISTFYPALSFGGPTKSAYELSKELAKRKNEVEVFTTNAYSQTLNFKPKTKEQMLNGFKVTYFNNSFRYKNIFLSIEMLNSIRNKVRKFDIVHTHFGRQACDIAVSHYSDKFGIPYIVQARGDIPRIMSMKQIKWIYDFSIGYKILKHASKAIALSEVEATQYMEVGVPREKIVIIPNGINLSEYFNLPSEGYFKNKFSISSDERLILFVGRIHKIKGLEFLIRAFSKVANEYEDVTLAIVGPDDGYLSISKNLVKQFNIEKKVLFTGALFGQDKIAAYIDSDFLVCPSIFEIFGNVVLESYACSRPVIASNVGGLQEIVYNGETGLLVNPGDIINLYSSMVCLLENCRYRRRLGLQARKVVEDRFSIVKGVDKLEAIYCDILKR
jgi:glycosyltransferase involved in cell wall biosynthesis